MLWCLFIGLFISNVIGLPAWLKPAVQHRVLSSSPAWWSWAPRILFGEIMQVGFYGLGQSILVVIAVWYFTWWIAKKMKIDDDFAAVLSSAVSICGVSAAIATGGAIKADSKKISYVTSIVLICAIPMMILQPLIAKWVGMSDIVAGAWLGGTLDTSGSVVAAGELISPAAMKTGVIVKMSQNVLIGVAAFFLSVVWTLKACKTSGGQQTPRLVEIWHRFPKFVLGFHHRFRALLLLRQPGDRRGDEGHAERTPDVVVRPGVHLHRPGDAFRRPCEDGGRPAGGRVPDRSGFQHHLDADSCVAALRRRRLSRASVELGTPLLGNNGGKTMPSRRFFIIRSVCRGSRCLWIDQLRP